MTPEPLDLIAVRHANPLAVLDALIHVSDRLRHYGRWKEELSGRLTALLELGQLEASTSHDGHLFTFSPGRRSYDYPEEVIALEAELQEARAVAIASGKARERLGKPFWTVRELAS